MSGKPQYDWPSDEDLLAMFEKCGGVRLEVVKILGCSRGALDNHIRRQGLNDQVKDIGLRQMGAFHDTPVDDPQRVRMTQMEAEVKHLRREQKDYEKALAAQGELFDRVVEACRQPVKAPKLKVAKQDTKLHARSVILPIYDQQYGQFVRSEDTPGGKGLYSTEVFDKRLARWVEGVTGNVRDYASSHRIEELIIPLGGDHVEGDEIFAGQSWQLEIPPPEQVWQLACKMEDALRTIIHFAKEELGVPKVAIYGVDDNHGKVGGRKAGARPARYSWNWLFLKILRDKLRAEPIDQFEIEPAGSLLFACADFVFLQVHGHEIKSWGGIPFYGLTKYDGRAMRLHRQIYDYCLMGHFHQPAEIPNGSGEFIISGDWVGANNLSGAITAASRPMQRVIYVARKWGIESAARIWFTTADEAYAPTHVYRVAA